MKTKFFMYLFLLLFGTVFNVLSQSKIILLNGASCSGKSTTAKALEKELASRGYSVIRISIDEYYQLFFKNKRAWEAQYTDFMKNSPFQENCESYLFDPFTQEIALFAQSDGHDFIIVDYYNENDLCFCNLLLRLKAFKVFFLKVCCTYKKACERLAFRNAVGGDQKRVAHIVDLHFGIKDNFAFLKIGRDFPAIHDHKIYDLEIDTTEKPMQECVAEIVSILEKEPSAFWQNFFDDYWIGKIEQFFSSKVIEQLEKPISVCCCW